MLNQRLNYGGFCNHCQKNHTLPTAQALVEAKALITQLETTESLHQNQPPFTTDILFGPARGQMFGLMLARNENGSTLILKGFSGQFNGHYIIPGWVPPLFDVDTFNQLNSPEEKKIKALSQRISKTNDPQQLHTLKTERRNRSRALMKKIHGLYILRNFHGEEKAMADFFPTDRGMPTGAGDCCAPKLIHYAMNNKLTPLGMAEFYFGLENRSKTRQHGHFYSSCESGCAPILGFMLCGL